MSNKTFNTYKDAEKYLKKIGDKKSHFIMKPQLDGPYLVVPRSEWKPSGNAKKNSGGLVKKYAGGGLAVRGQGKITKII